MKIGVDFGGVLSVTDISGTEHRNLSINMPSAAESLLQLVEGGHSLYLISFCGRSRAAETRASIAIHGLSDLFTQQFYVKKKEFKGEICKSYRIHCMIDDCEDVLASVVAKSPETRSVLFGAGGWAAVMDTIGRFGVDGSDGGSDRDRDRDVGRFCYLTT